MPAALPPRRPPAPPCSPMAGPCWPAASVPRPVRWDAVAEKAGVLAIIEVKSRPTLAEAATALNLRQQNRLLGACDRILGEDPDGGLHRVRFHHRVVDK